MKIVIEIKGKEVKLSPDEAEKLYLDLDKIFGKNPYPIYPYYPYPYYPYRSDWMWTKIEPYPSTFTWGNDTNLITSNDTFTFTGGYQPTIDELDNSNPP